MRKLFFLAMAVLLSLCLFGCGDSSAPATSVPSTTVPPATIAPTEPTATEPSVTEPLPTEPEVTEPTLDNTKLYGADVTGMTAEEAKTAISEAIANYKLTLTVNGQTMTFSSNELSMSLSEEGFNTWFEETVNGNTPVTSGLIQYNLNSAVSDVENRFAKKPVNATVVYSKAVKAFISKAHEDGVEADVSAARSAMKNAVETLSPAISAKVTTQDVAADILESDPRIASAAATANSYLGLKISYTYQATGIPTTTEAISQDTLASFFTVDKNLSVKIDSAKVRDYVTSMSYKNGGTQRKGFITSYGTTINQSVDYYSAILDQDAMYNDLVYCLNNKLSGTRYATFLSSEISHMPYGGSYVEIDLDNQCLWVYKNGQLAIKSSLVSGKVSSGAWTPGGVFTIYGKETCTYLVGPTWRSYVDYWMPFNGGIGLHDASWRDEFGGTIYMYDGSHGCINLPPKNAGIIYDNISVGTKVIVYGGAHKVGNLTQEFTGTDSYTLTTEDAPFSLNVHPKYTGTTITYQSSDDKVVTVDQEGLVTIVGAGSAQITVTSEKLGILSSATFVINITVEGEEPEPSDPTVPTEPTEPEETEPEETEPEETEPEGTEPEGTEPEGTEPEGTEPEGTEPEGTEPEGSEPEETEPENTEPEATEPPKEELRFCLKMNKSSNL